MEEVTTPLYKVVFRFCARTIGSSRSAVKSYSRHFRSGLCLVFGQNENLSVEDPDGSGRTVVCGAWWCVNGTIMIMQESQVIRQRVFYASCALSASTRLHTRPQRGIAATNVLPVAELKQHSSYVAPAWLPHIQLFDSWYCKASYLLINEHSCCITYVAQYL